MEAIRVQLLEIDEGNFLVLSKAEIIGSLGFRNTETIPHVVPECQICSKRGHTAPNYWKTSTRPSSMGQVVECHIFDKRGRRALDCHHQNNFAHQGSTPALSLTAMRPYVPSNLLPQDILDGGHWCIIPYNS